MSGHALSYDEMLAQLSDFSKTVNKLRQARDGSFLKLTQPARASQGYEVFKSMRKGTKRFSPPRFAPEIVPMTQQQDDELEDDSTKSQSSRSGPAPIENDRLLHGGQV